MWRWATAAAAALTMLFSVNGVSAATYTIDVHYNLLDGTLNPTDPGGNTQFESHDIPVSIPTLFAGDVINTTINFTKGLALTLNDPGPGRQMLGAIYSNVFPDGIVSVRSELSLLHPHGDLLTPDVVVGRFDCNSCVAALVNQNFTDSSFSFRGLSIATTILNMPPPFVSDRMHFQVWTLGAGDIEITHGASLNPVPVPAALPLFATGVGVMALLAWRRRRIATITATWG